MSAEILIGLLGIGGLSTGVLLAVGKNMATVSNICKKIDKITNNLEEVRDVMISMPCTEYNGHIKVNPNFTHDYRRHETDVDNKTRMDSFGIYDFGKGGFKERWF